MRLLCIGGIVFISFIKFAFCQQTGIEKHRPFLDHLSKEKLYKEKLFYIDKINKLNPNQTLEFKDSILIEKAKVFDLLDKSDSLITSIEKIDKTSILFKENIPLYNLHLLKTRQWNKVQMHTEISSHYPIVTYQGITAKIIGKTLSPVDTLPILSAEIHDFGRRYYNIKTKSPLAAGIFSAVIPGSGKWYAGRKWQGITAFIATGLLSAQAYESYRKDGVYSFRFAFSAGIFSIFYVGNIWGSAIDTKKIKQEKFLQLDDEVIKYINLRTRPLYQ